MDRGHDNNIRRKDASSLDVGIEDRTTEKEGNATAGRV